MNKARLLTIARWFESNFAWEVIFSKESSISSNECDFEQSTLTIAASKSIDAQTISLLHEIGHVITSMLLLFKEQFNNLEAEYRKNSKPDMVRALMSEFIAWYIAFCLIESMQIPINRKLFFSQRTHYLMSHLGWWAKLPAGSSVRKAVASAAQGKHG